MPEISGYGGPTNVYQKPVESKVIESDQRSEKNQPTVKMEGMKGVEVILSSDQTGPELETYDDLNRPAPKGLSPAEERVLDDREYQQRKGNSNNPGPAEIGGREKQALDSML